MKEDKFIVGSSAFFKNIEGFKSKDIDYLEFVDESNDFTFRKEIRLRGIDYFYYKLLPNDEMILKTLEYNDPLLVGKFLVPAVVLFLNFSIDDLKLLEPLFNKLDDKHKYEKLIYDYYIENNDFILTDELLNKVYWSYLKYRLCT